MSLCGERCRRFIDDHADLIQQQLHALPTDWLATLSEATSARLDLPAVAPRLSHALRLGIELPYLAARWYGEPLGEIRDEYTRNMRRGQALPSIAREVVPGYAVGYGCERDAIDL